MNYYYSVISVAPVATFPTVEPVTIPLATATATSLLADLLFL